MLYPTAVAALMRFVASALVEFIRPVQTDIVLNESVDWGEQYEDCMTCSMPIALSEMRQHFEECGMQVFDNI